MDPEDHPCGDHGKKRRKNPEHGHSSFVPGTRTKANEWPGRSECDQRDRHSNTQHEGRVDTTCRARRRWEKVDDVGAGQDNEIAEVWTLAQ